VAMERVWNKYPKARLHLFNCPTPSKNKDGKIVPSQMYDTFSTLIKHNKWWTFLRTLTGPVEDSKINELYNRAHIVVSGLYPLYARSIEAFGAGKAFIGPGYTDPDYPWHCELAPNSMAEAIIQCWEGYGSLNYREWAEKKHNVQDTARESVDIYQRYL